YPVFTCAPPPPNRPVSGITAPKRTAVAGAPALPGASVLNSTPAAISTAQRRVSSHFRTSLPPIATLLLQSRQPIVVSPIDRLRSADSLPSWTRTRTAG